MKACEDCCYFEPGARNTIAGAGECRRHAPRFEKDGRLWRVVGKYDWCGEFVANGPDTP